MEPVFIVAQYKAGTSWLLSALAAHPDVTAVAEIDIVKAALVPDADGFRLAPQEHRLEKFFASSAWSRIDRRDALDRGEHDGPRKLNLARPQSFEDLTPESALELYRVARDGTDPHEMLDAFLAATAHRAEGTHLVLKAADQIAMLDALAAWQPNAKKVAITRDGRDVAISARHYRRLMAQRDAPWYTGEADYLSLLEAWRSRAAMISERGAAGEVYVLRYEDLSHDFAGTFQPLLAWLGVEHSAATIEAINDRTSFEARTGRKRGTAGEGVIRKGAVGEWRDALDDDMKREAWDLAGTQLVRLGYTEDGSAAPLPAEIDPRRQPETGTAAQESSFS